MNIMLCHDPSRAFFQVCARGTCASLSDCALVHMYVCFSVCMFVYVHVPECLCAFVGHYEMMRCRKQPSKGGARLQLQISYRHVQTEGIVAGTAHLQEG